MIVHVHVCTYDIHVHTCTDVTCTCILCLHECTCTFVGCYSAMDRNDQDTSVKVAVR